MRQRRGWRQADLAARAGVSASLISLLECGQLLHVSMAALRRVFAALDAHLEIRMQWRGGEIDRLLDRRHAGIVERVVRTLGDAGWETRAEVSFSRYGERGSIDVLAWNAPASAVLLIEVKSEIYSLEETLRRFHVKVRLAREITAEQLGWRPRIVGSALVLPESSGVRRRLEAHAATMASVFADRGAAVRPWLRRPERPLAAIWFLSSSNQVGGTRLPAARVRVRPAPTPPDPDMTGAGRSERSAAGGLGLRLDAALPLAPTEVAADDRTDLARAGFIWDDERGT
jgi:transcriptional regulator with XRE-family HTH domain